MTQHGPKWSKTFQTGLKWSKCTNVFQTVQNGTKSRVVWKNLPLGRPKGNQRECPITLGTSRGRISRQFHPSTMFCKAKSAKKLFLFGDFRPLLNKNVQIWDHFFSLLFPKDSESLKILFIRLQKVCAKRPFNGTPKVNKHTDKHTYGQIDLISYRKHWPRGTML